MTELTNQTLNLKDLTLKINPHKAQMGRGNKPSINVRQTEHFVFVLLVEMVNFPLPHWLCGHYVREEILWLN